MRESYEQTVAGMREHPTLVVTLNYTDYMSPEGKNVPFRIDEYAPKMGALVRRAIDASGWGGAADLVAPFPSGAEPGTTESLTATWPLSEDTVYLALRSQSGDGDWSALSNAAFWPRRETRLPLVSRAY